MRVIRNARPRSASVIPVIPVIIASILPFPACDPALLTPEQRQVAEAVEHEACWALGVQWHPEDSHGSYDDRHRVFGAFVAEAVFGVLRRYRYLSVVVPAANPRTLIIAWLIKARGMSVSAARSNGSEKST